MFYLLQLVQILRDTISRLSHHYFRGTNMASISTANTSSITMTKCEGVVLLASEVAFSKDSSILHPLAKGYIISP